MEPFTLTLSNNGTVAGLHSLPPPPSSTSPKHRPLIVALHGGTYDCHYFDATPRYSASHISAAFGVPFIAIDRPCYGGTTSFLPVPKGSTFNEETGRWLHEYILPALWQEFGVPNNCKSIVLFCHSFGTMGGSVAAALHAEETNPAYPLAGLIASSMGDKQNARTKGTPPMLPNAGPEHVLFALPLKDHVMFKPGTIETAVLEQSQRLNAVSPAAELYEYPKWLGVWKEWAAKVKAPVMFALVEDDVFFESTEEEVKICRAAFAKSPRVDGSLVRGAPHCMELSYWSQGWYARCFGFAMECAAGVGVSS
ncbi:Alpha/Beta hydrolase protein [Aspergillus insuetus]